MSQNPYDAKNVEFLAKQVRHLKKQHQAHDPEAAVLLQATCPALSGLPLDQINEVLLRQHDYQAAIARQFGFQSWDKMLSYAEGYPRFEDGKIVLTDTPGLSQEEALNERANFYGMPQVGTRTANKHGIEWEVMNYGLFPMPRGFARYPGNCDYLPLVWPMNMSDRLHRFLSETAHCTSKNIICIDTMPSLHPFDKGGDLHYAVCSSNPEESYIFLDAANIHETTLAHEIGHLWLNYVTEGGDGMRRLTEEAFDDAKKMQLDFVQSFAVDLKVNDLIDEKGFDMSLITQDEINGLTMLRDAVALGYTPPSSREALLHSFSIGDAILDQKRWPDEQKQRLTVLLDFFETATPQIYSIAQELVGIVRHNGYDTRDGLRKCLDECTTLAFQATGKNFDIERDLEDFKLVECMKDKYPDELPGCPVPLKLEIGKTMARNRVEGPCSVWIGASSMGAAYIVTEDDNGTRKGPLPTNYQLVPLVSDWVLPQGNRNPNVPRMVGGKTTDAFGRLPGEPYYNTAIPPGYSPFNPIAPHSGDPMKDQCGRLPGDVGYNTCFPIGPNDYIDDFGHLVTGTPHEAERRRRLPQNPLQQRRMLVDDGMTPRAGPIPAAWANRQSHPELPHTGFAPQHALKTEFNPVRLAFPAPRNPIPMLPKHSNTELARPYMAGIGLAVARARLAQQQMNASTNLYQYAFNNPVGRFDPSGLSPRPGVPIVPCPPEVGKAKDALCAAIKRVGVAGITSSKCCTGPKQAQCLLDWCNGSGNIYCISDTSSYCAGACAFTFSKSGQQQPNINSYLCLPAAVGPGCKGQGLHNCKDIYAATILHERMHACGTQQGRGNPDPDPAENRAQCLCPLLGV